MNSLDLLLKPLRVRTVKLESYQEEPENCQEEPENCQEEVAIRFRSLFSHRFSKAEDSWL